MLLELFHRVKLFLHNTIVKYGRCRLIRNNFTISLFSIDERRRNVLNRRKQIQKAAELRRKALLSARNFQCFNADVDDLNSWLAEKLKTAADESYRDLNNIERKLNNHEAFERELRANEGQLHNINKVKVCFKPLFKI